MTQQITAFEKKVFQITLQSNFGSTQYLWALKSLPNDIILLRAEDTKVPKTTILYQTFYFTVSPTKEYQKQMDFILVNISNPLDIVDSCTVKIQVVPTNDQEFISINESSTPFFSYAINPMITPMKDMSEVSKAAIPYGFIYPNPTSDDK